MKDNFIIHHKQLEKIRKLSEHEKARLFDLLAQWRIDGEIPEDDMSREYMLFSFMKDTIELSDKSYEVTCERNRSNGTKGGRPKTQPVTEQPASQPETTEEPKKPSGLIKNPEEPKKPDKNRVDKNRIEKKDNNSFLSVFEKFRNLYKGNKCGLETEFENFCRHSDWKDILPKLLSALEAEIVWREKMAQAGNFVPSWANLKTWINQRRWEQELGAVSACGKTENVRWYSYEEMAQQVIQGEPQKNFEMDPNTKLWRKK